jgi:ElaB/YqjD/DUF883 family membrane-anchored ribosome-binding protein
MGSMTALELQGALQGEINQLGVAEDALAGAERTLRDHTRPGIHLTEGETEAARAKWQSGVDTAVSDLTRKADVAGAKARAAIQHLSTSRLVIDAETETAAMRREPLVRHAVETRTLPELAAELKAAWLAQDKKQLWLLVQLLPSRLERPLTPQERADPDMEAARWEMRSVLSRAREGFQDRSLEEVRKRAETALERAETTRGRLAKRRAQDQINADVRAGRKIPFAKAS